MNERGISLPELFLIAATRGMIGFGAGLLVSERIGRKPRKVVGLSLLSVGLASTVPLAIRVLRRGREGHRSDGQRRKPEESAMMAD